MRLRAVGVVAALVGALGLARAEAACPSEAVADLRFKRAEDFYIVQAFKEVRAELEPLVLERCFGERSSLQLARLFLGVSLHALGEEEGARRHLLDMLRADPNVEVGASIAPRVVLGVIQALREEHADELRRILQEMGQTEGLILDNFWLIIKIERRVEWLNVLPFGVGVFQNDDWGWGAFYASTQVVGLGFNVLGGVMVEGLRADTGRFSAQDMDAARAWRGVQIAGLGLFAASYVASVVHGWVGYRAMPEVRTIMPPSSEYPENELRGVPGFGPSSQREDAPTVWGIGPIVGPGVGGVGLFWSL